MAASPPPSSHMASTLLHRAHSPTTAKTLFREKVLQRPLLLRPTSPDPQRDARARRQHARIQASHARRKRNFLSKPRPLTAKQRRALGLYDLPPAQRKYALYLPLHRMWCAYMREILQLEKVVETGQQAHIEAHGAGPLLVTADFHGAQMRVVRSKCVSRVGVGGIVVKEGKFVFEVVTVRDEVKVLPKEGTVFEVEVPVVEEEGQGEDKEVAEGNARQRPKPLVLQIHGERFMARAPDRVNRKFKGRYDPDW